jgi:hypothetical protein
MRRPDSSLTQEAGGDPITANYPHFMTRSLRRFLRSAN